MFDRVDGADFKYVLAQAFQWYQRFQAKIKAIIESEQTKNLFDDGQSNKFKTGYKDFVDAFKKGMNGEDSYQPLSGLSTGDMKPDAALLREFGLPVPRNFEADMEAQKQNRRQDSFFGIDSPGGHERQNSMAMGGSFKHDFDVADDFKTVKDRMEQSIRDYKVGIKGDLFADRYGDMKFREIDQNGMVVIPSQDQIDGLTPTGESYAYYSTLFKSQYLEKVPAHVRNEQNQIQPPGQKFAHGLIQKYLKTAPINFQVHRPPKVMDLTQTHGDGITGYEKEGVKRRIQVLNLQNPEMNKIQSEANAKKIGFLKSVEPNYIDQKKIEVIESMRLKTNEFDDKSLIKQSIHAGGRVHTDVVPLTFMHQQKVNEARKELRNIQSTFNSVLANPSYDDQVQQIDEVQKLKIELARKGVQAPIETLKRGMVLAEREKPAVEGPRKYLRGNEFLMVNPYKKPKKESKSTKRRGSIKKSTRGGSPSKSPRKKRVGSAGSDDMSL